MLDFWKTEFEPNLKSIFEIEVRERIIAIRRLEMKISGLLPAPSQSNFSDLSMPDKHRVLAALICLRGDLGDLDWMLRRLGIRLPEQFSVEIEFIENHVTPKLMELDRLLQDIDYENNEDLAGWVSYMDEFLSPFCSSILAELGAPWDVANFSSGGSLSDTSLYGVRRLLEQGVYYWECNIDNFADYSDLGDYNRWAWKKTEQFLADSAMWEVLEKTGFFRPDAWIVNAKSICPIITSIPLPRPVKSRIKEIFQNYIIGNFISVISLSRSVLEYVLLDKARKYEIDTIQLRSRHGVEKKETKRLEQLVEEYSDKLPDLRYPLQRLKEHGNQLIHPKHEKAKTLFDQPDILRKFAVDGLTDLKQVLEFFYKGYTN